MVLVHIGEQRLGRLDDIGVEEDLVDDRRDLGVFEQGAEVVDLEAVLSADALIKAVCRLVERSMKESQTA